MNRKSFLASGLLAAMLAAATVVMADEAPASTPAPDSAAAPAAPAADASAATPAAAPAASSDMGTVVFFRPSKFVGGAIGFIVREGDKELGKLRNGKYFSIQVSPGKHQFVVHSEAKDVLTLEVDSGETYYVQGSIGMGFVAGRPNLSPSDQATFEAAKSKLKEVAPMSDKD